MTQHRRIPFVPLLLLAGSLLLAGTASVQWELVETDRYHILAEHSPAGPGSYSAPADAVTLPNCETGDWMLTLVNKDHPIPEDWSIETCALPNGKEVDARIYSVLMDMLHAGEAEGLSFVVCSAYRTLDYQQNLFDRQVARYLQQGYSQVEAEEKTAAEIAVPGTSEHHLGLAVDIVSREYQVLDEQQASTQEQQWLMEHCWEYGFVLRYPVDRSDLTGIIYEPWHYRYVGKELAKELTQRGICLEEYWAEQNEG